jgi:hypothetical protein
VGRLRILWFGKHATTEVTLHYGDVNDNQDTLETLDTEINEDDLVVILISPGWDSFQMQMR